MASKVAEAYMTLRAGIDQFASDLAKARNVAAAGVASIATIMGGIRDQMAKVGKAIGAPYQVVVSGLAAGIGFVAKLLTTTLGGAFQVAATIAQGAFSAVNILFKSLGDVFGIVTSAVMSVVKLFTIDLMGALTSVVGIFTSVFNIIGSVLSAIASVVSAVVTAVGQALRSVMDLFEQLLSAATTIASKVIEILGNMAAAVVAPAFSALKGNLLDFDLWIKKAMAAETQAARFNAVVQRIGETSGWTADQLKGIAFETVKKGGYSMGDIRESMIKLGVHKSIQDDQFKDALEASRQLAAVMGTDMQSAARALGMALENPLKATRALREAGLQLSPLEKEQVKAAMAAGNLAEAQQVILDKIKSFGDVAGEFAKTTEGRLMKLGAAWGMIGRTIGDALLPIANIVIDFIQPLVEGMAQTLTAFFGGVAGDSRSLLTQARQWIAQNREQIVTWGRYVGEIIAGVVTAIKDLFLFLGRQVAAVYGNITGNTNVTFDTIQMIVTQSLEVIKTAIANLPLAWDIAWTAIKIGAAVALDFIERKLEELVARIKFLLKELHVELMLLAGEAANALNPASGPMGLDDMAKRARAMQKAGELDEQRVARAAMDADIREIRNRPEDQKVVDLTKELKKLNDEFKGRMKVPVVPIPEKKAGPQLVIPEGGHVEDERAGSEFKFGFIGFSEMYKDIQKSITGGGMEGLQRRTAVAAEALLNEQRAANKKLDEMNAKAGQPKPAAAGP